MNVLTVLGKYVCRVLIGQICKSCYVALLTKVHFLLFSEKRCVKIPAVSINVPAALQCSVAAALLDKVVFLENKLLFIIKQL